MENIKDIGALTNEISKLWEQKLSDNCPFWNSLSNIYYNSDKENININTFYSEISFYPRLIEFLTTHFREETQIEITFLSTLLPRHYWNFPVSHFLLQEKVFYFFSTKKDFLDEYRKTIVENIGNSSIVIKRILVVAKEEPFYFKNTYLFSNSEIEEDKKFYFLGKEPKTRNWSSVINNPSQILLKSINSHKYSTGCDYGKTCHWFTKTDENHGLSQKQLVKSLSKDSFYIFEYDSDIYDKDGYTSVYDFYVNQLHTTGEAKSIILSNNNGEGKDKVKPIHHDFDERKDQFNISEYFKPDLALLTINKDGINEKKFILNTYMDLFNDIIKLEVIEEDNNEESKYQKIYNDIQQIICFSGPLSSEIVKHSDNMPPFASSKGVS